MPKYLIDYLIKREIDINDMQACWFAVQQGTSLDEQTKKHWLRYYKINGGVSLILDIFCN